MAAVAAPLHFDAIKDVMKEKNGAFILIDCASGEMTDSDPASSGKRLPPCSTFKIWNALVGIEEGVLTDAAEPFYQWDGVKRSIEAWNKDMNLRGDLPVKPASIRLLKQLMEIHTTPKGTLYGKTGSGASPDGKSKVGWFVGFSESGGRIFAFATCLQGKNSSGAEARTLTETILQRLEVL